MVDKVNEENPQHGMQPKESLIPENVDQKEREQNDEANRMRMGGPSMRPRPQPRQQRTPQQIKALESARTHSHQLTRQLVAAQSTRQNWRSRANTMRRVQNALRKNPALRNALFTAAKGDAIAFVSLDAKSQLRAVKTVDRQIRDMAHQAVRAMQNPTPDPLDVTNPYNQANPNSLVNQQQAIQQGVTQEQDNLAAQEQEQQEITTENNTTAITLTAAEAVDIEAHNQQEYSFSPTPTPTSPRPEKQADDEEIKAGEKKVEEEATVKAVMEHRGEEKALEGFMHGDKTAFMDGAKGAFSKGVEKVAEEGLKVGMSLMKGAAGG